MARGSKRGVMGGPAARSGVRPIDQCSWLGSRNTCVLWSSRPRIWKEDLEGCVQQQRPGGQAASRLPARERAQNHSQTRSRITRQVASSVPIYELDVSSRHRARRLRSKSLRSSRREDCNCSCTPCISPAPKLEAAGMPTCTRKAHTRGWKGSHELQSPVVSELCSG